MSRWMILFLTLFLGAASLPQAMAQTTDTAQGIVAVVNDEPISQFDLNERLNLVFTSPSLPNTPEVRARLIPQVLQELINETLQRQEAQRLDIKIDDAQLALALTEIETRNNIPAGQLEQDLRSKGVALSTLRQKVLAALSWQQLVLRKAGRLAAVDPAEVEQRLARLQEQKTLREYRYGEIFVSVDENEKEEDVRKSAMEIYQQLAGGADFSQMAENFSERPSGRTSKGLVDWTAHDTLDPKIAEALSRVEDGFLIEPMRLEGGYMILLKMADRTSALDAANLPSAEQIAAQLRAQKITQVARKYLNDLRRDAIIDLRLPSESPAS